jgi:hypothetical protein
LNHPSGNARVRYTRSSRETDRLVPRLGEESINDKEISMMNGRTIAMAVCGLLLAGAPRVGHADTRTKEAKVKCQGINECKGKGSCATATNDCAGKNACKSKGWIEVTTKECKAKKGTVIPDAKPEDKQKAPVAPPRR